MTPLKTKLNQITSDGGNIDGAICVIDAAEIAIHWLKASTKHYTAKDVLAMTQMILERIEK